MSSNLSKKTRLVICMSRKTCNAHGEAEPLYQRLLEELGEPSDFRCTKSVRWEHANCLGECGLGPNLVFYPEREWFHYTDPEKLEHIIQQFLALRAASEIEIDN
jgi:(2Fe-2S) ferredoxin